MLKEWLLRAVLSGAIASLLYVLSAGVVSRFYNRDVNRNIFRHDVKLGFVSLIFGSPVIQGLAMLSEKYHVGFAYTDFSKYGWVYWVVSIPIYVFLWDAVFYVTHRVLHWPLVYRKSHFRHHSCRPPVPWSGIAIDPFETILSGIMPYTIPLLILPFQIYTVYAVNIALMVWATVLHSTHPFEGNALFLSPRDHNLHHAFGLKNSNFAAVFTVFDRLGGTLNRKQAPPWWGKKHWSPKAGAARTAITAASVEGSAFDQVA